MRALTLALVLALAAAPRVARQQPIDPNSPRLTIDFTATDRRGAPVGDLRPDDVDIWIGHFRAPVQQLTHVTSSAEDTPPRTIVLLLDDVTLPQRDVPRAKEAARRLISRMLPGDRMSIVGFSGTEMKSTDDHARLLSAIDAYNIRATGVTRIDVLGEDILKNVAALSRQMSETGPGRKAIVAIGSGTLFDRPLPPPSSGSRDLTAEWTSAMRALAAANASFYVIDPSGVSGQAYTGEDGFARASGGRAFVGTNDLAAAADRILRDTSDYYLARVPDPPNSGGAGSLRELDVRVRRPGVTVLARRAIP